MYGRSDWAKPTTTKEYMHHMDISKTRPGDQSWTRLEYPKSAKRCPPKRNPRMLEIEDMVLVSLSITDGSICISNSWETFDSASSEESEFPLSKERINWSSARMRT